MKDVIISITGVQNYPQGTDDSVELVTEGKYSFRDGRGELSYMESELTGMQGTRTSFTFTPTEVVLSREGTLTSKMIFREGTKNTFSPAVRREDAALAETETFLDRVYQGSLSMMGSAMTQDGAWHCNQKCLHCYAAGQPVNMNRSRNHNTTNCPPNNIFSGSGSSCRL